MQDTKETTAAAGSEAAVQSVADAEKIIIAIHGIGDQYQNATIKTVLSAVGRFWDYPAATPLGRFRSADGSISAFTLPQPPVGAKLLPRALKNTGFVEIYWANLPRAIRRRGYVIEESKAWARTIVERVRARYGEVANPQRPAVELDSQGGRSAPLPPPRLEPSDFLAAADAIEEMIETIAVLENVLWLAEKAGVLRFDLAALLPAYLGTVQIVGDFADYRRQILDKFRQVLDEIEKRVVKNQPGRKDPEPEDPEIYIVAHSEGSVIALMGLLKAMCDQSKPPPLWVNWIRGFMTIGSPIDKHLILWPDIWDEVQNPHPSLGGSGTGAPSLRSPIQWRNYWDYGDPVGFELDTTRDWLQRHGWRKHAFEFWGKEDTSPPKPSDRNDDYGFGRYLLPGAAHNGYWDDDAVFGHFLGSVVFKNAPASDRFSDPPRDDRPKRVASFVIPYALVFVLIYLGTYLLYKAMTDYLTDRTIQRQVFEAVQAAIHPSVAAAVGSAEDASIGSLFENVFGIAALLAGVTALARIPRLTRRGRWVVAAMVAFIIGASLYLICVSPEVHRWHAFRIFQASWLQSWLESHFPHLASPFPAGIGSAVSVAAIAALIGGLAGWGGRHRRKWTGTWLEKLQPLFAGARPLIIPGALYVAGVIICRLVLGSPPSSNSGNPLAFIAWSLAALGTTAGGGDNPLWPILLAGAAFLYLWWLAILLFDLVFVWHRYIRHSLADISLGSLRAVRVALQEDAGEGTRSNVAPSSGPTSIA